MKQPKFPRSKVRPFWKALDEGNLPTKDLIDWFTYSYKCNNVRVLTNINIKQKINFNKRIAEQNVYNTIYRAHCRYGDTYLV